MPYPDAAAALPWWMQQGGQPTPPGANGMGWLQYLNQMFGDPDAPSPDAQTVAMMHPNVGGGFAIPGVQNAGVKIIDNTGTVPPDPSAAPAPAPAPSPSGTSVTIPSQPPGYLSSTGATGGVPVAAMGYYSGAQPGLSAPAMIPGAKGGPATTPGAGPLNPAPGRDITVQPRAAAPTPGPMAAGNRFIPIQYGNMANARGPNSAPIYTALNLNSLFSGQPQGAPSATPRAAPDFSALPDDVFDQTGRVAGPMAKKKRPSDAVAAASLKQRYG
jgi:hypothetical protein